MSPQFPSLHPEHLADLERSGLTTDTIKAAGIYTVPPGEIGKKLGGGDNGIESLLAFPYPGDDGHERFKCWYEEGKSGPKYRQKKGSPNHLYLLPTIDLESDSPLLLVEGEKKTLALMQAGYQVVGLGGVWNWCERAEGYKRPKESRPIPDLARVNWRRPVSIVFDSDGHNNRNVRLAAFRLARELSIRGAAVSILFLPAGENGEKVGGDDYLLTHGPEALADLLKTAWPFSPTLKDLEAEIDWQTRGLTPETPRPDIFLRLMALTPTLARLSHLEAGAVLEDLKNRLDLPERILANLRRDVKVERQSQEAKKKKGAGVALGVKNLDESFRLHPAIHFLGDAMSIGFRVHLPGNETGLLLLVSDGQGVRAAVHPETIEIGERVYQIIQNTVPPFVQDVWNLDRLKAFLDHPSRPRDLYQKLVAAFKHYLDLPEPAYGLMAAWTVGTYFAHLFAAYSFLHFHGPKESGKSKSLEALRYACFNAWKGRDISAPALGDTMDGQRGTLLLDQAEKLNSDKENGNLIGLLADSYKKAGGQRRVVEVTKAGRSVLEFSTFGAKAFASTKPLDPDLADRCVKVPMTRTRRKLPDLEGWEPLWGELRDELYRFTLAAFKDVQAHYEANHGNGTRIGELWRPMLAVLLALGVGQREIEDIQALFMAGAEEGRHELTSWEVALFEALKAKSETTTGPFEMSAQEIIEAMRLGDDGPGPKWIGEVLCRFHLFMSRKQPRTTGGKRIRVYEFSPSRVEDLFEIYFRDTLQDDLFHLCQDGEASNGVGERGTAEKYGTCANPCHERREQAGTRDTKETCSTEIPVNTDLPKVAQVEHVKLGGGVSENDINLFSGEEVVL